MDLSSHPTIDDESAIRFIQKAKQPDLVVQLDPKVAQLDPKDQSFRFTTYTTLIQQPHTMYLNRFGRNQGILELIPSYP